MKSSSIITIINNLIVFKHQPKSIANFHKIITLRNLYLKFMNIAPLFDQQNIDCTIPNFHHRIFFFSCKPLHLKTAIDRVDVMPSLVRNDLEVIILSNILSNFIVEVIRPALCNQIVAKLNQSLICYWRWMFFRGRVEMLQPFRGKQIHGHFGYLGIVIDSRLSQQFLVMISNRLLTFCWFRQICDALYIFFLQIDILIDIFARIYLLAVAQFCVKTHICRLQSCNKTNIVFVALVLLFCEFCSQVLMISTYDLCKSVVGIVVRGDGEELKLSAIDCFEQLGTMLVQIGKLSIHAKSKYL